jgi:hypothetical protein
VHEYPVILELGPITLREARAFIAQHHRHNVPPRGWLFGAALRLDDEVVAVGVAGRPLARPLQDGHTIEVLRVCIAPHPHLYTEHNAASRLYGALCRAATALGYWRAVSYTLASERGTSLRAAGFTSEGVLEIRTTWASADRPRYDANLWGEATLPSEQRVRWVRQLIRTPQTPAATEDQVSGPQHPLEA